MLKLMEVETCGLHKRNSGSDVSQSCGRDDWSWIF